MPVTMITEIMNFDRLLWWLPWHCRLVLVFGVPFFAQYNLFGANVYICYDYVHLDNLSDTLIETTTGSNVKCKSHNRHIRPKIVLLSALRKSLYVYDSVVNSILNRTFKIRKV